MVENIVLTDFDNIIIIIFSIIIIIIIINKYYYSTVSMEWKVCSSIQSAAAATLVVMVTIDYKQTNLQSRVPGK